jgi:ADP-ribose pyrophosphatase YjhB (NUDIX family)
MAEDKPIGTRADGSPIYDNTATVVCVLTSDSVFSAMLLMIRRKSGLLGLPGGFQMGREKWQEAGARELLEETGYVHRPRDLFQLIDVETDEYGHNMIFAASLVPAVLDPDVILDGEALEVLFANPAFLKPDEWEFPMHYAASIAWLKR